jgi:hypothetical protein
MFRYLITPFLLFLCCTSSLAETAETEKRVAGQRLLGIFSPKPGVWSEYAIFDKATGRRTVLKISIVGIEQDAYWYEVENREETSVTIFKMLTKGDPVYPENIERLIIKSGPGPAREVGGESAFMKRLDAGRMLEQQSGMPPRSTVNLKSVETGTGEATVVAGTFDVSLHEIVDQAGKVYARYKFSQEVRPFGIVSSETDTKILVLGSHGTGARSEVTEEPVIMNTQPPGMGQGGIIMQIPGMGTGYELKE